MNARHTYWLLPAATAALIAAGCGNLDDAWKKAVKKIAGPSPTQRVAMAFDMEDADRRREGVMLLSKESWGRAEKYCDGYALLLANDEDASVRAAAVQALGRANNPKYSPNIIKALDDKSDIVRANTAMVLDNMPSNDATEPLQNRALFDESSDVRMWSAKALRHYRTQQVVKTLRRCLDDGAFGVCYQARSALVEITGRDLGYEGEKWDVIATNDLPDAPPPWKRPWWDWFGTTKPKADKVETGEAAKKDRPWWDWFGTTKPKADKVETGEAAKKDRPWWDWFGVT